MAGFIKASGMTADKTDMTCPYCDGNDIRRLARRGISEIFLSWLGRWPYGCESCHGRFFLSSRAPVPAWRSRHRPDVITDGLHRLSGAIGHSSYPEPRTSVPAKDPELVQAARKGS